MHVSISYVHYGFLSSRISFEVRLFRKYAGGTLPGTLPRSIPADGVLEKNNSILDDRLAYYKEQHALYLQLQRDCKHLRADIKHTGDLLAEDYPDSQSIKHGLTVALMK
jgi:hypothetical protein